MKIQFENRSEKLLTVAIILIIAIGVFTAFQSLSNKELRKEIKKNNEIVKELEKKNEDLNLEINISEDKYEEIAIKVDSVEKSEKYFKYKYYSTDEKLKQALGHYSDADDDTKNKLFSNAINN